MANYNTTTEILIAPISNKADSVTGSIAKAVNDYFQTVDGTKTVRALASVASGHNLIVIVIHDS